MKGSALVEILIGLTLALLITAPTLQFIQRSSYLAKERGRTMKVESDLRGMLRRLELLSFGKSLALNQTLQVLSASELRFRNQFGRVRALQLPRPAKQDSAIIMTLKTTYAVYQLSATSFCPLVEPVNSLPKLWLGVGVDSTVIVRLNNTTVTSNSSCISYSSVRAFPYQLPSKQIAPLPNLQAQHLAFLVPIDTYSLLYVDRKNTLREFDIASFQSQPIHYRVEKLRYDSESKKLTLKTLSAQNIFAYLSAQMTKERFLGLFEL